MLWRSICPTLSSADLFRGEGWYPLFIPYQPISGHGQMHQRPAVVCQLPWNTVQYTQYARTENTTGQWVQPCLLIRCLPAASPTDTWQRGVGFQLEPDCRCLCFFSRPGQTDSTSQIFECLFDVQKIIVVLSNYLKYFGWDLSVGMDEWPGYGKNVSLSVYSHRSTNRKMQTGVPSTRERERKTTSTESLLLFLHVYADEEYILH